jgi:hypothetical protein
MIYALAFVAGLAIGAVGMLALWILTAVRAIQRQEAADLMTRLEAASATPPPAAPNSWVDMRGVKRGH